jgi:ribosome-interacting GTPase 1
MRWRAPLTPQFYPQTPNTRFLGPGSQKNKATEYHLGQLKAKIAKLRTQLLEGSSAGGGGPGAGFDVAKTGHARVALIGFPSVGKSTMLCVRAAAAAAAAATPLPHFHGKVFF